MPTTCLQALPNLSTSPWNEVSASTFVRPLIVHKTMSFSMPMQRIQSMPMDRQRMRASLFNLEILQSQCPKTWSSSYQELSQSLAKRQRRVVTLILPVSSRLPAKDLPLIRHRLKKVWTSQLPVTLLWLRRWLLAISN